MFSLSLAANTKVADRLVLLFKGKGLLYLESDDMLYVYIGVIYDQFLIINIFDKHINMKDHKSYFCCWLNS